MADSLKQFYSNSDISYTDLAGTGLTIASTNGSQKSVIKDIDIGNPNSKSLTVSIDGVPIASVSKTETLYGNVILDNSKEIKLISGDSPVWTDIRSNYGANTVKHYTNPIKDDYFTIPGSEITLGDQKEQDHSSSGATLTTLESTNQGDVTFWHADQMFNKPTGDMYYMSGWRDSASSNNKLNYFDYSANSASNLVALSSDYMQWYSGYSNKYLVQLNNGATKSSFRAWNTASGVLTTVTTKIGGSGTTSANDAVHNWDDYRGTMTCLDKYMVIKRNENGQHQRDCALVDIETGKKISWTRSTSFSDPYKRNGGSYGDHIAPPQLVKNSAGNYYMLWMVIESSGSAGHGLQIMDWSTDPSAVINANVNNYYSANQMGSISPLVASFNNQTSGLGSIGWTAWRVYDSTSNYQGWGSGWCPLKKLSPTDSYSRYWLYANAEFMLLIDVDDITAAPKKVTAKVGGSTSNSFIGGGNAAREAFTWTPYIDNTQIASGFGTIKARTSGILVT